MEKILIYKDGEVVLERDELRLIPEFAALLTLKYNKQSGDNEGRKQIRAFKEFTYIWFIHSYNSPYREYDEKERRVEALQTAGLSEVYEFSTEFRLAEKKYLSLIETRVLKLIKASEKAVDKIRAYLEDVDLTERSENNALVNKPSDIIKIINDLDSVADGLDKLANRQKKEKQEFASTRGAQEAGWLMEKDKFTPVKPVNNGTSNGDTDGADD